MKSVSFVLAALSFTAQAFLKTRAQKDIEGPIVCLNNETYHPEDYIPVARIRARADVVQLDAYAHILVSKAANVPAAGIVEAKFATLNRNFAPWGYIFNLKAIQVAVNANWASDINVDKAAKQKALRKGNYQALNVYLVEGAGGAECTYPRVAGEKLTQASVDSDGCFVPLGLSVDSATITHEVGHWMGLAHVFEGGCASNDGCDDTLPQANPSYGKLATPGNKKSCPSVSNLADGVANDLQMDYSDCAQEFTKCQGRRMDGAWQNQRKGRNV
ncbi:hypothetical protein DE146DRAFT_730872 [Phaeosphaeria sp. MPI-PUGE-AT-0046c]|nr:hypothetical protein DE146DRAFT_730872 [Phaeosphaeria sp. MPI-PUGE-AT-0046c]